MDPQQISAPLCAPPLVPEGATPSSGVIHINFRHAAGFTVIGNHLAQHRNHSLVAVGLAVHIQSLPGGAKISIKALAERFPESETRIAAALRELEARGYLHRSRLRLANGRIATRTMSFNQPNVVVSTGAVTEPQTRRGKPAAPPAVPSPPREPAPAPAPQPAPTPAPVHVPQPAPASSAPVSVPVPTARRTPSPPLPQPQTGNPELHRKAATLLADLRRHAPQLLLSENDIHTLTPGVVTWLERNTTPDTIRRALTTDLPIPLKHPTKLLRHRIATLLPPPLPGTHDLPPLHHRATPNPFQECDGCGRPFHSRNNHPTRCRDCRDCRDDLQTAA